MRNAEHESGLTFFTQSSYIWRCSLFFAPQCFLHEENWKFGLSLNFSYLLENIHILSVSPLREVRESVYIMHMSVNMFYTDFDKIIVFELYLSEPFLVLIGGEQRQ